MVFWHVKEKKGENAVEREQRLYIEKAADIIRESACASVPLSAKKIAEKIGIKVIEKSGLDKKRNSTLKKTGKYSIEINIQHDEPEYAKRLDIAHEIGHAVLHMGYLSSLALWDKIPENTECEFSSKDADEQAGYFMRALLMPKSEMEKAAKKYRHGGEPDAAKMAELFGMSVMEVVRREKELGLLD